MSTMRQPTTEVILCTYNGRAYIAEQLRSILSQSTPVDRISIHDDCSTDGTVEHISNVISRYPSEIRAKVAVSINSRNLGYARNFINAITESTEEVLFLCDQDDIWENTKIETCLDRFTDDDVGFVFSDGRLMDKDGQFLGERTVLRSYGLSADDVTKFGNRAFEHLVRRNYINGAAIAIRRSIALAAIPLPCDMPHDYWLALWASQNCRLVAISDVLYRYRLHDKNQIGIGSSNLFYRALGIWRQPRHPRDRELMILEAVVSRLSETKDHRQFAPAILKLQWLRAVLKRDAGRLSRLLAIVLSAARGSYRQFSNTDAFWRDVVSLIR
jgi:glycosyltransferase involved in cell wall biosynthesis